MKTPKQLPGCLPPGFDLDSLLTVKQFATWRQIAEQTARNQIAARIVPAIETNRKDVRVNPRTCLEFWKKNR